MAARTLDLSDIRTAPQNTELRFPPSPESSKNSAAPRERLDAALRLPSAANYLKTEDCTLRIQNELSTATAIVSSLKNTLRTAADASPEVARLVRDAAKMLDESLRAIPPEAHGEQKQLAASISRASESLNLFSIDYEEFLSAPSFSFLSPQTWGASAKAASVMQRSWQWFEADFACALSAGKVKDTQAA